jgi:hypothetical protein
MRIGGRSGDIGMEVLSGALSSNPFDGADAGAFLALRRERGATFPGQSGHEGGANAEMAAVGWGRLAIGHGLRTELIRGKSGAQAQLKPMVPLFLRIDEG